VRIFCFNDTTHCGFNLNRYRLAQQGPRDEAITINLSDNLIAFENINPDDTKKKYLAGLDNGIYFVGLDFHVGYLLKEGDNLFFIHSNYIGAQVLPSSTFMNLRHLKAVSITSRQSLPTIILSGNGFSTNLLGLCHP
jgi:hypothetical protein